MIKTNNYHYIQYWEKSFVWMGNVSNGKESLSNLIKTL